VGPIYIDGLSTRDKQSQVLTQRRSLSKDGVLVLVLKVDRNTGRPVEAPVALSSGFMEDSETTQLFEDLGKLLAEKLTGDDNPEESPDEVRAKIRETARSFIASETRRSPTIIPVVMEV
jgi:ribonuclease J